MPDGEENAGRRQQPVAQERVVLIRKRAYTTRKASEYRHNRRKAATQCYKGTTTIA